MRSILCTAATCELGERRERGDVHEGIDASRREEDIDDEPRCVAATCQAEQFGALGACETLEGIETLGLVTAARRAAARPAGGRRGLLRQSARGLGRAVRRPARPADEHLGTITAEGAEARVV